MAANNDFGGGGEKGPDVGRVMVEGFGNAFGDEAVIRKWRVSMGRVGRTLACAAYPTSTYSQPASPRSLRLAESLKSSISRWLKGARLQGSMSRSWQQNGLRPRRSSPDTRP